MRERAVAYQQKKDRNNIFSIQHIDFSTVRGEMSENQQPGITTTFSKHATQTTLQNASVLSSTGDKFV